MGKDRLPQGLEPSRAEEPELGKDRPLQGLEPSRAAEPEMGKDRLLQGLEPLPRELHDGILGRLSISMHEVIRLRPELGRYLRNAIDKPAFRENRPSSEGEFSPSFFETDVKGDLHWRGFDQWSRRWTTLPSLNFAKLVLPSPDQDLFKDYLVAGGLLCINVGKASGREKLVVCNPLTQQVKVLPPLNHSRHPVLMDIKVDLDSGHYKVFVAGSATIGTAEVSLKTEEYDSRKIVWECPDGSDLPCQPFGLNEYQNGVYVRDSERELLMWVAIIDTRGRGVLVYDITKKKWAQSPHVKQLHIPLVSSEPNVSHLATTQIVECGGSVFVFSEQECGRDVYFLIHKLVPDAAGDFTWDEVVRRKRTGGRGLLVYPEFTCVPVSEHELCIFNTIEHTLDIVDQECVRDVYFLCSNVGKASLDRENLVVCNYPLTQQAKVLPPLIDPRHPVLMHIKVNLDSGHYRGSVAGSAAICTEELALKTEEYDLSVGECPDVFDSPFQILDLQKHQPPLFLNAIKKQVMAAILGCLSLTVPFSGAHAENLVCEVIEQSSAADGNVGWLLGHDKAAVLVTLASVLIGGAALKLGVAAWRWMLRRRPIPNFAVDQGLRRSPMPTTSNPDFVIHPRLD